MVSIANGLTEEGVIWLADHEFLALLFPLGGMCYKRQSEGRPDMAQPEGGDLGGVGFECEGDSATGNGAGSAVPILSAVLVAARASEVQDDL